MCMGPLRESDVVCVGVQELVKLDISGFLLNFREDRGEQLERRCRELLTETHVVMEHITMVGLDLAVYVRKRLVEGVTHIDKFEVKTGAGGAAGNKGGVGVRFQVYGNEFTIVNVHLDAGELKHQERAQALETVLGSVRDGNVVIMGDFNFRLSLVNGDCQGVLRELAAGRQEELLGNYDEGKTSYRLEKFRKIFLEGKINFPPTYKFVNGSNNYILDRTPAWCDRVFYKAQYGAVCNLYEALEAANTSDHKPVVALLAVEVRGWPTQVEHPRPEVEGPQERDWVVVRHNYLD